MAQRAEPIKVEGRNRNVVKVMPERMEGDLAVPESITVTPIKPRPAKGRIGVIDRAARSYSRIAEKSNVMLTNVRRWAEREGRQNPLQVVAVVAGAAFVLGIVLRIWKSRRTVPHKRYRYP